jgi:hypothetical protein
MFAQSTVNLEVAVSKRDCGKQKNEVLGGSSATRKLRSATPYSLNRRGCPVAADGGFRRATPTTPRTVNSAIADRGT